MKNAFEQLVEETCAELDRRGRTYRKVDVWGFVKAAQPCDDTAEDFADGWEQAAEDFCHREQS